MYGERCRHERGKAVFERDRPDSSEALASAAGFSFPSGHAMSSLAIYGALTIVAARSFDSPRARMLVAVLALALVLAIGFSRVYLGVHYASDVLAGFIAGLAWPALCSLFLRRP